MAVHFEIIDQNQILVDGSKLVFRPRSPFNISVFKRISIRFFVFGFIYLTILSVGEYFKEGFYFDWLASAEPVQDIFGKIIPGARPIEMSALSGAPEEHRVFAVFRLLHTQHVIVFSWVISLLSVAVNFIYFNQIVAGIVLYLKHRYDTTGVAREYALLVFTIIGALPFFLSFFIGPLILHIGPTALDLISTKFDIISLLEFYVIYCCSIFLVIAPATYRAIVFLNSEKLLQVNDK